MATYSTLRNGSRGEEVKKLQQALINAGYNVGSSGADGIYGANTAAAVKKYQQDNKLTVDGLAGNQTLSSLYKTGSSSSNVAQGTAAKDGPTPTTGTSAGTSPYSSYSYDPSSNSAYQNALKALQAAQSQMTNYSNSYQSQLEEIYNKIMNREKFSYDLNSDMLYNQYKDQYLQQGKMAMMDTMGQAAALTGGYGNSYASTAGNQAYQGYLQELNNIVPELYQQALNQYNTKGQELYNQYALIGDMADDEYQKYQDSLNQYWQNLNYLKSIADDEYTRGYENWYNSMTTGANLQQKNYDNLVTLITTTGYAPTAEELKAAGMTSAQAGAYKKYYTQMLGGTGGSSSGGGSGGGGSRSGGGGGGSYNNGTLSASQIKQLQNVLGVTADGKYGSNSKKAAGGLSAEEAYAKYVGTSTGGSAAGAGAAAGTAKNKYSGWNAGDWEYYFAYIRQTEGSAAAQEELRTFTSQGLIPKNMVVYASAGARGSSGGH